MPTPSPALSLYDLKELQQTYTEAEAEMLAKMQKRLKKGITQSGWTEAKWAQIGQMTTELRYSIAGLETFTAKELRSLLEANFQAGGKSALGIFQTHALQLATPGSIKGLLPGVNTRGIEALFNATYGQIQQSNLLVLRKSLDQYRAIVADASQYGLLGVETRQQVAQRMLNKMADSNVQGFTDKAGRVWSMDSYAEMASRTAMTHAYINGRLDQFAHYGIDLVQVGGSSESCPLCAPWEGKILSQSGSSPTYPSLDTAVSAGLFHPNCTHNVEPFVPEIGPLLDPAQMDAGFDPEAYAERQQQRSNERDIRRWKRRQAVAMGNQTYQQASAQLAQAKAKQQAFLDATGRKRLAGRESIGAAAGRFIGPKVKAEQAAAQKVLKLSSKGGFAPAEFVAEPAGGAGSGFLVRGRSEMNAMMQGQSSAIKAAGERIVDGVPTAQVALSDYTNNLYEELNGWLRHPDRPLPSPFIRHAAYSQEERITYLEANAKVLHEAMEPLPRDTLVFRGVPATREVPAVGDILQDDAFFSTSLDRGFASSWGDILYEVEVPRGTPAIWAHPFSSHHSEQELLLDWGQRMEVLGVRTEAAGSYGEKTVIRVRIIGSAYTS